METQQKIQKLLEKVEATKAGGLDLSSDEDLSIGIMNLVAIEEHFFFTGAKTGKSEYYELLNEARQMRKELLKKIIKEYEGEVWCISKHLLAAAMRLMEVGTKYLNQGQKKEAEDLFSKAYKLYSLFWGLNLKITNVAEIKEMAGEPAKIANLLNVKKINDDQLNVHDVSKTDFLGKLGDIIKKLLDCCKE